MTSRSYRLVVAAEDKGENSVSAVLGRDIRSRPAEIARFCLMEHRGIMEDVATVAESIALADRLFSRRRGSGWTRRIALEIPVYELATFQRSRLLDTLSAAAHFLTGDIWNFQFSQRAGRPLTESLLPFQRAEHRYVTPYSDGLDSYAQTRLLEKEVGPTGVLRVRSARMGHDSDELQKPVLRVPRHLGPRPKPEKTYRTRPFVFFSFAGIGAFAARAEAVIIGETGQGALGPAMVRYAGEWPFRSTHPGFVARLSIYLSEAFGSTIDFRLPQLWHTKGEVLRSLADQDLLGRWEETRSCSLRPNDRHGAAVCGICGGCVLRALATSTAGLVDRGAEPAFDIRRRAAKAANGDEMSLPERHMAVRSFGGMAEFARLAENARGQSLIEAESMLFEEPDVTLVAGKLRELALRHRLEYERFVGQLPHLGWARVIADQL